MVKISLKGGDIEKEQKSKIYVLLYKKCTKNRVLCIQNVINDT